MINIDEEKLKELVFKGLKIKDISEQMIISISTVKRKMKDLNIKSNLYLIKNKTTKCNECNYYFNSLIADNRKFCSKSCSAKFNNKKKSRKDKKRVRIFKPVNHGKCLSCDSEIIRSDGRSTKAKYCNRNCQSIFNLNSRVKSGKASIRTIKLYLIKQHGAKCMDCGWDKKNLVTNKVPIELEHIDGNSENNNLDNLKLLCPNCHSLTPTYKALNKGNGRSKRRERYKEGKSY